MRLSRYCPVLLALFSLLSVLCYEAPAWAHDFRPAVLSLRELEPGRFAINWTPASRADGREVSLAPAFPSQCRLQDGETSTLQGAILDCGKGGLHGTLKFLDPDTGATPKDPAAISVDLQWLHGERELVLARGDPPALTNIGGQGAHDRNWSGVLLDYGWLGVEHILGGPDHLLFVLGLLLLVHDIRRLVLTISAFTLSHSITLSAAALGFVALPSGPVEFAIALSILLLAVEVTQRRATWTSQAPWAVAFGFGLLHGFGFAGALAELGLPKDLSSVALLAFNLGVEAGQLSVVATLLLLWRIAPDSPKTLRTWRPVLGYALGGTAAYWTVERAAAMALGWF